jgi:hypothetical protein
MATKSKSGVFAINSSIGRAGRCGEAEARIRQILAQ